jgi:hypothetical protein
LIEELQAGPELDWSMAENVMGWHVGPVDDDWLTAANEHTGYTKGTCFSDFPVWRPSTGIAAAWQVVERLREKGIAITVSTMGPRGQTSAFPTQNGMQSPMTWADTAPLAICRAAHALKVE